MAFVLFLFCSVCSSLLLHTNNAMAFIFSLIQSFSAAFQQMRASGIYFILSLLSISKKPFWPSSFSFSHSFFLYIFNHSWLPQNQMRLFAAIFISSMHTKEDRTDCWPYCRMNHFSIHDVMLPDWTKQNKNTKVRDRKHAVR